MRKCGRDIKNSKRGVITLTEISLLLAAAAPEAQPLQEATAAGCLARRFLGGRLLLGLSWLCSFLSSRLLRLLRLGLLRLLKLLLRLLKRLLRLLRRLLKLLLRRLLKLLRRLLRARSGSTEG